MLIKRDQNEELEEILEHKKIDEQAKNLLQEILYKIDITYKDYKKVKSKKDTKEKYIQEILENIQKKCDKISIVNINEQITNQDIQKELKKKKYFVGEEIVSYPIEEKILYAIEKKSNFPKILNNKYEEATIAISDFINTGRNQDRVELLRDFTGWSWTTMKNEMENIEANLIYQMLQIVLGEEFLENWCKDKDGIIDYLEVMTEELTSRYNLEISRNIKDLLIRISLANTARENKQFNKQISEKILKIDEEIENYEDTHKKVEQITVHKKQLLKELNEVEQILIQESKLQAEYERINQEAKDNEKIFNIKVLKKKLNNKKEQLLEEITECNEMLKPLNFLKQKDKLLEQKQKLHPAKLNKKEVEQTCIEFIEMFLKCFKFLIENANQNEEIVKLIYQFRYFMLVPYNLQKSIKDVKTLQKSIIETEKKLVEKAIKQKAIVDVPFEIMRHVFETRIIILEELYYKIMPEEDKFYVQIFDENISDEKFEITPIENTKINKKIKIFI